MIPVESSSNAPVVGRRTLLKALTGSALLAATGLSACGASDGSTPVLLSKTSKDFAGAPLTAVMRKSFVTAVDEIRTVQAANWAQQANASVDMRFLPDWREVIDQRARDRSGADLVELFSNSAHVLAPRLTDLSEVAEALGDASGGWFKAASDAAIVDGVWRAIPWAYTAHAINYRADLLAEIGSPELATYDDLLEAATRLSDAGLPRAGFTMGASGPNDSASFAYSMLWSFGGSEVDESGIRVALDSEGTRAALRYFAQLSEVSDQRWHTFDEVANNNAFLAGEIAMTQNAASIYAKALAEAPGVAEAMDHVKYPTGPAGYHQLVEMNLLGVFAHSPNTSAAADLVRHLTEPEQLTDLAAVSLTSHSPSLHGYTDDPAMPWNANPKLRGMKDIVSGGHMPGWPGPAAHESGRVYANGSIVAMFARVGVGEASIEEAVKDATAQLKRVYET